MYIFKIIIVFGLFIFNKYISKDFVLSIIECIEKQKQKRKLNYYQNYQQISVSYGLNNKNFYPTFVSITSILENANYSSFYIINILVSKRKKNFSDMNPLFWKISTYKGIIIRKIQP